MIITGVFYAIKCDRCGKVSDSSDAKYYADMESVFQYAKDSDWIERGKKHYCPNCYIVDEDTEIVRIKPPRPVHLDYLERFINGFLGCKARVIEGDYYEVLFYGKALSTLDDDYIREMLGSNLISLEYKPHARMEILKCLIKIKK